MNKTIIRIPLLGSFFLSAACKGQRSDLEKFQSYFGNDLISWAKSFKNFNLSNFIRTENIFFENINAGEFDDSDNFYKLYKSLISFSQDRTKFIDIYSYQLNLDKKGARLIAHTDGEQVILLCDLRNSTWIRILFQGFSQAIEDVAWISNTKFILAGIEIDEAGVRRPEILIGDTNLKLFNVYSSQNKNCLQSTPRFKSDKLKKMKIAGL